MSSKETVGAKKNADFTSKVTSSTAQRRYKDEDDQDMLRAQSLKRLHQGVVSPNPMQEEQKLRSQQHETGRFTTLQDEQSPYAGRLQALDDSMSQKSALTSLAERAFMQGAKPNSVFELILRANDKLNKSPSLHSGMTLSKRRVTVGSDLRSQTSTTSKAYQQEHAERLVKELDQKARKRKQLELIAQTKEMEACTFRPKIISRMPHSQNKRVSSNEARRFYQEELEFQNRKQQKIEAEKERNLVHLKMTEASGKPEICKGSERIYKRKIQEDGAVAVHQRLYKNGKDFFNKHQMNSILQESLDEPDQSIEITASFAPNFTTTYQEDSQFQPKINKRSQDLKRKGNVTSLLDQDAKRRQEKFSLLEKQGKSFKGKVEASKKSGNLMFQKFEKRLTEVVLQYDSSKDQSGIIMYQHFGALMASLGFVYIGEDKVAPEVPKLLHELWECMCYNPYASQEDQRESKQSGITSFQNLRAVLAAILNFYFVWMEVEQPVYLEPRQRMFNEAMPSVATSEATENNSVAKDTRSMFIERTYGAKFTEDGKVSLSQQGQQQLHHKFKAFYYIYHQNYTSDRKQKAQIAPPQHTFKPAVCRSSERMDMSRRNIAPLSQTGGLETVLEADANLTAGSPLNIGQSGGLSRHDLLLKKGMEYQEKKRIKMEEKKAKEVEGLNFKPKLLSQQQALLKQSSSAGSIRTKNLKEINNILRERAKATITDDQDFIPEEGEGGTGGYSGPVPQYQQKRTVQGKKRLEELAQPKVKRARTQQELEFERNKNECSFKPKIQAKPENKKEKPKQTRQENSTPDLSHLVTKKDLDGTVDGLNYVAHKKLKNEVLQFEKEQSSRVAGGMDTHPDIYDEPIAMTQEYKEASEISQSPARGEHDDAVQNFTLKAEDEESDTREVILEMNVKLEDGRSKVLYIREGDTAAEAAALFSQKMGIPKSLQNKLEVLVQQQMNSLLSKIEEEEELSCIASSKNGNEMHQAQL